MSIGFFFYFLFFMVVLEKMSLRQKWIRWIKWCICSTKFSILVIKTLFRFFQSSRGSNSGTLFLLIYSY